MISIIDKAVHNLKYFLTPGKSKYELWGKVHNNLITLITMLHNSKRIKCNICGWEGNRFYAMVIRGYIRKNVVCYVCGSSERHRSLGFYMSKNDYFKPGMRILDIAPIQSFETLARDYGCNYTSIDIGENRAMIKMDIEKMGFPDGIFDLIICSHVLEHVKDDVKALSELYRVLKQDGKCIIIVPFNVNRMETIEYEKPDPLMENHVRDYGRDIIKRINSSEFKVEEGKISYSDTVKEEYGLYPSGKESFFLCVKY